MKAGNIISLVIVALALILLCYFFLSKKSPKLAAVYLGVLTIYTAIYVLSWTFDGMELAKDLAGIIALTLVFIAVVVYQNDFKAIYFKLSGREKKNQSLTFSDEELQIAIEEMVRACQRMSKARMGALIVVAPTKISQHVLESGVEIGGQLSASLIESIFNTKAPMHDGAVIVKGNKILAAGCFLPLSQTQAISKELGTRHRAAIGITEESDNISIVISEENGIISVAQNGVLRRYITPERLSDIMHETYGVTVRTGTAKKFLFN